jgi:hypothetical protein
VKRLATTVSLENGTTRACAIKEFLVFRIARDAYIYVERR